MLQTYLHWTILVFLGMPVIGMIAVAIFLHSRHIVGGQILHVLISRASGMESRLDILGLCKNVMWSFGPLVAAFPVSLVLLCRRWRRGKANVPVTLFLIMAAVYSMYLLASGRADWTSYVILLALPLVVLTLFPLTRRPFYPFIPAMLIVGTALFSFVVVYGSKFHIDRIAGIPVFRSYGYALNRNSGMKTLAYLLRSGAIPVSRTHMSEDREKGEQRMGVFIDYEGGWFYCASHIHDWCIRDLSQGAEKEYEHYLLVYRVDVRTPRNASILAEALRRRMHCVGIVTDEHGPLMRIYGNEPRMPCPNYSVERYDALFDKAYANLPGLARSWLGSM